MYIKPQPGKIRNNHQNWLKDRPPIWFALAIIGVPVIFKML